MLVSYFTVGSYTFPTGLWVVIAEIIPVPGVVPAVLIALLPGGVEGNVLVPRIMGSSFGVHPLLVFFATLAVTALYGLGGAVFVVPVVVLIAVALRYLRWTLLFEHWHLLPVVEIVVEGAPGLAASDKEPVGFRGCYAGGER